MSATVHELPSHVALRRPLGHAIRTGESSYRQLEHLYAEGRLPSETVIVDASKTRFKREFIRSLREHGSDIILDTKVAELSELGKFKGAAKGARWAPEENRPLLISDFEPGSKIDLYGKIARHAVDLGVTAVMAPAHFLRTGANEPWLEVDRAAVLSLRTQLDREAGAAIAIDYPLILPHTRLLDPAHRLELIGTLTDLPIDNLTVRLSGFGADSGPLAVSRVLVALGDFHRLGYPIVLDHVGGLVGLSALAFGVASDIAHGIGEHDRFDARDWHKPPKDRDSESTFGRSTYIPLPGFDKSFRKADLQAIAAAAGGRRLVSCQDPTCCAHGLKSMLDNPRAHIAHQKRRAVGALYQVPDSRRIGHFLDVEMREAERKAGDLVRLNLEDDKLKTTLIAGRKRIDSMARMYELLAERDRPIARPIRRRNIGVAVSGLSIR
jgi:hypothetical protein